MADVITRLKVESSEYDSKIKRATQSLNEMTTAAEKEGNKIATANKQNIALAQSLGKMATVSTTARGKMSELSAAIESATIQYNRLSQAEKQGQFGKALNASITQLQGRLKGLQGEMAAVQMQMGKVGAIGSGGMGIGAQFGQGLKSAAMMFGPAALAVGGVTAAIGGMKKVFGDMVQINMQFEQSTANLASIMGKSTTEISDLTAQAKQLGATTRYTAMEITELQTNLARLGFTQQEILNSTKAVQALATATGADLGEAANLAGAALRGFGLNATEMERVASVLSVSTTKSALSFEKLATAVPIVAPVAKQFGFTIEDTVTLLAKLSDAGMDASSAATATRNIFLKMANDSGKLATAMGRPVHSVEEFGEALAEMRKKGMSLNDILSMVGVRSTAAFAVFADNAETLADFKKEITDCGEAMHDMESKQLNTLQGSITILHSAWEGLMLSFNGSNGIIKKVVDSLTDLLSAWTEWNNRVSGGEEAVKTFEKGVTDEQKAALDQQIAARRAQGVTDDQLLAGAQQKIEAYKQEETELQRIYDLWLKRRDLIKSHRNDLANGEEFAELRQLGYDGTLKTGDMLASQLAAKRDKIAQHQYVMSVLSPTVSGTETGTGTEDEDPEKKKNNNIKLLKAQYEAEIQANIAKLDRMKLGEEKYEEEVYKIKKAGLQKIADLYQEETAEKARANAAISQLDISHQAKQMRFDNKKSPQEQAEEKVAKALENYETTIALATIRKEANLDTEEQYTQKELSAHERLFDAYTEAYNLYTDPKYKEAFDEQAKQILELAKAVKGLRDKAEEEKQQLSQQKQLDNRILGGLTATAKKAGWNAEQLGVTGFKTKINAGIDITEDEWKEVQDNLNQRRQSLGLDPIRIDFETGNIETVIDEAKRKYEELMSSFSTGVGAVGDLVSAMGNMKSIGEDLADVFSGEKDAWDSLMTVLQSGVSIMQTVLSVTEAMNTLKELGIALSAKRAVTEGTEAAATVSAASIEATAEGTKAAASLGAAGANAAEASSASGKAVAGIPIVGPVLAVAAIATVLGVILSAISKSKSAGKGFALGGIVPGNSYSGDNLRTSDFGINSGELILNRAQQNNLAGQLRGNPMNDLNLSMEVEGTKMLLLLNNTNRSLGGDRNFYTRRH